MLTHLQYKVQSDLLYPFCWCESCGKLLSKEEADYDGDADKWYCAWGCENEQDSE